MFMDHTKWVPFLTLFIAGCYSADDFRNTPTIKICEDLMRFPHYNVNRPAREEELKRRDEDCSEYVDKLQRYDIKVE